MKKSRPSWRTSLVRTAVFALLAGILGYPARAQALQQSTVTGTVTDAQTGRPLAGAAVGVVGTGTATRTDAAGRYSIQAPANGRLAVSFVGYTATEVNIGGRTTVDVPLQASVAMLEELVVTGYQTQRRQDITAAVSTVNVEAVERQSSASVLQRLAGAVPGVTVENSGSPGSRSTVRIRGVSSFQNNSPLYIIDGTPVEDQFANFLNPHDVESIQVLKDASAASIYGARANNGVIIITTKKGRRGAPQVSIDANFGVSSPVRGYDDFLILNSLDYFQVVKSSYENAGQKVPRGITALYGDPNSPSVPEYIYVHNGAITGTDEFGRPAVDRNLYSYPRNLIMGGPANGVGTNWWDEVFGTGEVRDVNLAVRGGGANERYSVGFNYFDQLGTAIFNRYQRGTVRANTDFNVGRLTVGENLSIAFDESYGGQAGDPGGYAEGGILGKNILIQPVIPVRDIAGNYASGKAPFLGNQSNPVKESEAGRDRRTRNTRILGNAFARFALTDALSANTSLGINAGEGNFTGYDPIYPENSEPNFINGINEWNNRFMSWTWNNTLTFQESFADRHNVNLLVGQEAIRNRSRFLSGGLSNLVTDDPNARYIQGAIGDPGTRTVSSSGGISSLLSFFGKADYNFADRYYLSGTLRRDGSSRLGPEHRWGTFPAFSAGWRVSEEPFMTDQSFFTNLMLRFGWGVTGNQNIAAGRTVNFFGGGPNSTFYDIAGTDTRVVQGFTQTALGNPNLKWEENKSTNVGLDAEFFGGNATLVVDVYQRDSENLLFNPPIPATAGAASAPIVNVGEMRNRGIDAQLGFRGAFGNDVNWNLDINGSHYRNEIVHIAESREFFYGPIRTRFATTAVTINQVGHPIGSFFGYIQEGIYQDQDEINALNATAQDRTGRANAVYQTGAKPGRFRFKDVNEDGVLTAADRTIIGSPHPDFTAGLNFGLSWRNFDLAADVFGTFGNEIFDVQKEFYVFRHFNSNVRKDILTDSWEPGKTNAKYPRLDVTDNVSREPSSFYVEDGSYVRMRSLQLGYRVPRGRFAGFENVRVFVRGENLFTMTGYSGLDPSLPAANISSAGMDVSDQGRGIDRGVYPSNRTLTVGFGVGF